MRILLIHQAYCGPDDPGGTRHFELGQRLVADGMTFTVITSSYSYLTGKRKNLAGSVEGIDVYYAGTLGRLHRSYSRRTLSFLSFAISSAIEGLRLAVPDVVLGTSPPMFQALSAWLVATVRRRPFVLEVRDLWPEFAIALGVLRNRMLIALARWMERFLYSRASHIVVNSPAYRDYLLQYGIDAQKISVIANGVDAQEFDPQMKGDGFRNSHRLENKIVAMYAGAIGLANDLDVLLQAAKILRAQSDDVVIVIVGDGKERPQLQQKAEELELENVRFIPARSKREMPTVLAAADVCVATLKDIPMFRTTYPNKVFDYMAAGRPTVLAIDGVIREVVESAKGGIFVPPGDAAALVKAILDLSCSPELRREMGSNARSYVEAHFNRSIQAHEFAVLLTRISQTR